MSLTNANTVDNIAILYIKAPEHSDLCLEAITKSQKVQKTQHKQKKANAPQPNVQPANVNKDIFRIKCHTTTYPSAPRLNRLLCGNLF